MTDHPTTVLHTWTGQDFATDPEPTLFQKVLLATDGTVTELLSLHAGQPILAHKVAQTLGQTAPPPQLNCRPDEPILHRTVVLQPVNGGDRVFAESHFVFSRFSAAIQRGLLDTEEPIGLLWRLERLEMFREVIARTVERSASVATLLGVPADTRLFSRTYSISHAGMALGVITEKFAAMAYR